MLLEKIKSNLIIQLILGVITGAILGFIVSKEVMQIILTIRDVLGQIIFFSVPLIIIGFIAPSIAKLKADASKMLGTAMPIVYMSSIGAGILACIAGYFLIPYLNISSQPSDLRELPEIIFELEIPQIMPTMTALVLALFLGLSIAWTRSATFEKVLDEFNDMVLGIVNKIIIPILPFFIAGTFSSLAYEGTLTEHLPVFLQLVFIIIVGHFIWLAVLYLLGGFISKENPLEVVKHYLPAYLAAVGTMSSAATLPVALKCAKKSKVLNQKATDFAIPLGATVHLCGSVLTETFFVMAVSQILYGYIPSFSSMLLFILLLGIFAIGAPGVPGGTVMASMGLLISVLGFDQSGVALVLTIFAIQDSFGTACNVTGDGAIALILTGIFNEHTESSKKEVVL
ncbi:dicarboxylate/amino acid:cation symporter [Natroniella acetigena]|uniref:dicarboxylate/amino acid:cation symporter n=1 Tax=Natroniella acetigena TaxID=52004 RepID=UPI00200AB25C|nr:dicarboxylate/amino acid:cation symporter [Natroniella acetigena]MCK8827401.1 dicarboxylate/amino acid:cation symporter [Natroniella acetigena]